MSPAYMEPGYYNSQPYGTYGATARGSCMPPPSGCNSYSNGYGRGGNTTVIVVQPQQQQQLCGGYYSQPYTNRYYAQPYSNMGQQVWNTSPIYDPYSNAGYVDPYYYSGGVSVGRQAAIIGLQAADMVGSQFIKLAISDILYRP